LSPATEHVKIRAVEDAIALATGRLPKPYDQRCRLSEAEGRYSSAKAERAKAPNSLNQFLGRSRSQALPDKRDWSQ
jgi:hypothetical protein